MLGITILPEYIQSEGPEALLDRLLERLPLTAVSTSPYVMEECPAEQGGEREPPADSDKGLARLLERPLWGKNEVWVSATPSFEPNLELYDARQLLLVRPDGSGLHFSRLVAMPTVSDEALAEEIARRVVVCRRCSRAVNGGGFQGE